MHTAYFCVRQRCIRLAVILTLSPLLYETIHTRCAAPSRGFWLVLQSEFFLYVRNFWWVFRRAFVRVQIVAKVVFFSFVGQVSFFSFVGQNKKKNFRRDFVRSPFLLFSGGTLCTHQSCLAKVSFFSFVGKVSFFSFVGQNKKKISGGIL